MIAHALSKLPSMLLLDQPFDGLDRESREQLQQVLPSMRKLSSTPSCTTTYLIQCSAIWISSTSPSRTAPDTLRYQSLSSNSVLCCLTLCTAQVLTSMVGGFPPLLVNLGGVSCGPHGRGASSNPLAKTELVLVAHTSSELIPAIRDVIVVQAPGVASLQPLPAPESWLSLYPSLPPVDTATTAELVQRLFSSQLAGAGCVMQLQAASVSHTVAAVEVTAVPKERRQKRTTRMREIEKATQDTYVALHPISWQLNPNEWWLLCGANGAGKSTITR